MKKSTLALLISLSIVFAMVPVGASGLGPIIEDPIIPIPDPIDPIEPIIPDIPDITLPSIVLSDSYPVDRTLSIGETVGFSTSLDPSSPVTESLSYAWHFTVFDAVYVIEEGDEIQGLSFNFQNNNWLQVTAEPDAVPGEYGVYCVVSAPLSFSDTSRTAILTVLEEEDVTPPVEEPEEPEEPEDPEDDSYVFPFADVADSSWYRSDVETAHRNGLINGKTPTLYYPDENMTVAEAIKLAASMHQLYYDGEVTLTNGSPNWYSSYVSYAVTNSIIEGEYPNYNSKVSRQEFVHIFYPALPPSEYGVMNSVADGAIPDVPMSGTYAVEIYSFYRAGILTGSDAAGTFNPMSNIKRSEVAAILTRMFDSSARKAITLPPM